MGSKIQNAIGTQKQFGKQPQSTIDINVQAPTFSQGISQGQNLNALALANALGALGDSIIKENIAEDRRKREQFTTDEAMRLIAAKTPEERVNLDRIAALQHSNTGYDLTDNKYAMAALERALGGMAANDAKANYYQNNNNNVPATVEDAVKALQTSALTNYDTYKEGIKNQAAFDYGFQTEFVKDTFEVSEQARQKINADYRAKGQLATKTRLTNLITSNVPLDVFVTKWQEHINELPLYTKDRDETIALINETLGTLAEHSYDTQKIKAIKDTKYFPDGSTIGEHIPLDKHYKKIANNSNYMIANQLASKYKRADGTIDTTKARSLLEGTYNSSTSNLPQVNLKISAGDSPDLEGLNPTLKNVLPSIGGILFNLGYSDQAEITSGYRDPERNNNAGGVSNSYHLSGNAVDIYLGDLSPSEAKRVEDSFKANFGEVLYHETNSGLHLHLADYKGGLESTGEIDNTASGYDPERVEKIMNLIEAKNIDIRRENQERQNEIRKNVTQQAIQSNSQVEALEYIYNSNLPEDIKQNMVYITTNHFQRRAAANATPESRHFTQYERTGLYKDEELMAEYDRMIAEGDTDDLVGNPKLQEKCNDAARRLNKYRAWLQGIPYEQYIGKVSTGSPPTSVTPNQQQSTSTVSLSPLDLGTYHTTAIMLKSKGYSNEAIISHFTKTAKEYGQDPNEVIQQLKRSNIL